LEQVRAYRGIDDLGVDLPTSDESGSPATFAEYGDSTSPNFAREFVRLNSDPETHEFLASLHREYKFIRPPWDVVENKGLDWEIGSDHQDHTMIIHAGSMGYPRIFEYTSSKPEESFAWRGYVMAHLGNIFFIGFCVDGGDVSHFMLKKHPDIPRILVGMQSLFLSTPARGVSRHIAGVPEDLVNAPGALKAAKSWIDENRRFQSGLVVKM
jgi:hypothetical protein